MDQPGESEDDLGREDLLALADLATSEGDEIVERALTIAREILGMDLAYMTQFTPDDQVYERVAGASESFGMKQGAALPLEGSYCQRMVLGKIPNLVRDTSEEEEVRDLELTRAAQIGAYVGVPITLTDGTVYGTICGTSHEAAPELGERDVKFMHVLARMVAGQVEQRQLMQENRRLRGRIDALKVEVDQDARREQVEEITASDWFGELSERAGALRRIAGGAEPPPGKGS